LTAASLFFLQFLEHLAVWLEDLVSRLTILMLLPIEEVECMHFYSWGDAENLPNRAVRTRVKRGVIVLKEQERASQMCREEGEKTVSFATATQKREQIPYQRSSVRRRYLADDQAITYTSVQKKTELFK
jgi:hypothetical protein